jgi:simple sugar transport system permease protein
MPRIAYFPESAILPKVFGVHAGWIIAIILAAFIYILIKFTKLGYEISVLGENASTARYAGMSVSKIMVAAVILSGGICGLAGMMQASAIENTLSYQLSGGLGFTAIITAWLANLNPIVIIVVSLLFAMLLQGGAYIQSALQIPAAVALMLQGIILIFVLGSEFFLNYSIVSKNKLYKLASEKAEGGQKE